MESSGLTWNPKCHSSGYTIYYILISTVVVVVVVAAEAVVVLSSLFILVYYYMYIIISHKHQHEILIGGISTALKNMSQVG